MNVSSRRHEEEACIGPSLLVEPQSSLSTENFDCLFIGPQISLSSAVNDPHSMGPSPSPAQVRQVPMRLTMNDNGGPIYTSHHGIQQRRASTLAQQSIQSGNVVNGNNARRTPFAPSEPQGMIARAADSFQQVQSYQQPGVPIYYHPGHMNQLNLPDGSQHLKFPTLDPPPTQFWPSTVADLLYQSLFQHPGSDNPTQPMQIAVGVTIENPFQAYRQPPNPGSLPSPVLQDRIRFRCEPDYNATSNQTDMPYHVWQQGKDLVLSTCQGQYQWAFPQGTSVLVRLFSPDEIKWLLQMAQVAKMTSKDHPWFLSVSADGFREKFSWAYDSDPMLEWRINDVVLKLQGQERYYRVNRITNTASWKVGKTWRTVYLEIIPVWDSNANGWAANTRYHFGRWR